MKMVQIKKYGDLIPVQLRENWEPHLDQLAQTHGEASIVLEDGRTLSEIRQHEHERERAEREAAEAAEAERLRVEKEAADLAEAERLAAEEAARRAGGA